MRRIRANSLFALLILFLVQIACDVDPGDPRMQPAINREVMNYQDFLQQLSLVGDGIIPIPWITEPATNPAKEGEVKISGWGYTQEDIKSKEIPTLILYLVKPSGCGAEFETHQELGRIPITNYQWTFENIKISKNQLIGAVISVDGKKSELSNLITISPTLSVSKILQSNIPLAQFDQKLYIAIGQNFVPITVVGKAIPNMCISMYLGDEHYNHYLTQAVANDKGDWSISDLPIQDGENKFFVESFLTLESTVLTLNAQSEIFLQWPFGNVNNGQYQPDYSIGQITSWYGKTDCHWYRRVEGCNFKNPIFHNGIDIFASNGTPIHPVAPGRVLRVSELNGLKFVVLDHGGWGSMYLHLSKISVKAGDTVELTTIIGNVGNTGLLSTGYHLHLNLFTWGSNKSDDVKTWGDRDIINLYKGLRLLNINPTKADKLKNGHTGADLKSCAGDVNYWNIPWEKIKIDWSPGGTSFIGLRDEKCQ